MNAAPNSPRPHVLHRVALVQTAVIMLVVVIAFPIAFRSMGGQLLEWQQHTLYAFPRGTPIEETQIEEARTPHSLFNLAAVDLDEVEESLTLAISGQRICDETCPDVTVTLVSLNADAYQRRELPSSASVELTPEDETFTQTVVLPVQGQPSLYPFDTYVIWLGLTGSVAENGQEVPLTPALVDEHAIITTQNQLRDFTLLPPVAVDPQRVPDAIDPFTFFGVQELRFDRPIHMEILTTLLISLMAVSAMLAVAMRNINDLAFGIGTLILAVWSVRSVIIPEPLPITTSVDMALSVIILLVLLGLTARAAWHLGGGRDLAQLLQRWHPRGQAPPAAPENSQRRGGVTAGRGIPRRGSRRRDLREAMQIHAGSPSMLDQREHRPDR